MFQCTSGVGFTIQNNTNLTNGKSEYLCKSMYQNKMNNAAGPESLEEYFQKGALLGQKRH